MDLSRLAENLGLTKDEYLELIELLIETGRVDLEMAEAALRKQDAEEAAHRLHSIKGAAGNLGLMELYEEAKQGEQMAKQGMLDQLSDIIRGLRTRLDFLAGNSGD